MIKIFFTGEEIEEAREHQRKMRGAKEGLPNQHIAIKDNDIIGRLGERAYKKYLDYIDKEHTWTKCNYERYYGDNGDFIIDGVVIDVKGTKTYDMPVSKRFQVENMLNDGVIKVIVGVYVNWDLSYAVLQGKWYLNDFEFYKTDDEYKKDLFYCSPENIKYVYSEDIIIN